MWSLIQESMILTNEIKQCRYCKQYGKVNCKRKVGEPEKYCFAYDKFELSQEIIDLIETNKKK